MPGNFLDFLDHFITLLAASLPGRAHTKERLHEVPLGEMIKRSKIIVIGKVLRIKDPIFRSAAVATIEIEQIIAGNHEGKKIDITYYPRSNLEARFVLNERCIFFIDERNAIVKGYAGKITIENDKLEVHHILGEPINQTLKDFIQRIKDTESRQKTTGNLSEVRE